MTQRTLTITLQPDWKAALRHAGKLAKARTYQGEVLNFESAAAFFGRLTEKRWQLINTLQAAGATAVGLRELARLVGRDVKRVSDDVSELTDLGLVERNEQGGVLCPYAEIHIDMHMHAMAA